MFDLNTNSADKSAGPSFINTVYWEKSACTFMFQDYASF